MTPFISGIVIACSKNITWIKLFKKIQNLNMLVNFFLRISGDYWVFVMLQRE